METERFLRLRRIFDEAVLQPATEWDAFLQRVCGGDESLHADANDLLRAHLHQATTAGSDGQKSGMPPRVIGPYRIVRELGAGGMGEVFLAVRDDGIFRKNVAVKLLMRKHASHEFLQRFHQERQVLANLDHPNIARILDGGQTSDGLPYHVMEYVEGLPLDTFCDTQKLNLPDRIRLFQQVVAAVSYLHENLVVHRDLKPSNILVTAEGQVKLLDFGIAKIQTPLPESPDLTSPANRLLTPNYASPEQVSGAPVSKASDIYSLGVILYELLTGRLPFPDCAAKLSAEPPLPSANIREDLQRMPETTAQLRRRIVGDLDQIVLLCLRHDPRHRYASTAVLGDDLSRFLEGKSVLARKEPLVERTLRFLKRNRVAAGVAALILLSCGVGAWKTLQAEIQTRRVEAREDAVKRLLDSLNQRYKVASSTAVTGGKVVDTPPPLRTSRIDDVRILRHALEQDLTMTWTLRPGDTPARRALLERAASYLDKMRVFAARDLVLTAELAIAYKDLGALYEPCSRNRAVTAYRNAALLIEEATTNRQGHAPDGPEWAFIVARIKNLGGTVPAYSSTVTISPRPPAVAHLRAPGSPPAGGQESQPEKEPDSSVPAPQSVDPAQYDAVETELDSAVARAKTAGETMQELQASAARLGQLVHPEIRSNYERMTRALDSATLALRSGNLEFAKENIRIAKECARRVISVGGR